MQQTQISSPGTNTPQLQQQSSGISGIASISQPAQRYDYTQQQLHSNTNQTNKTTSTSFYANFQKAGSNTTAGYGTNTDSNKWLGIKNVAHQQNRRGGISGHFKARRNNSGLNSQVQIFYCEVCKISCAGPQVN